MILSPALLHPVSQRRLLVLALLMCWPASGCQTPGFPTALSGKKASAQPVSSTQEAGLPKPTNTATSNSPLSLSAVDEHLRLGEEELSRGNLQQAQMHFDHVLEQHPDHVKAHHRLGVLADKLGQFAQAEQHYLSALNGDPRNAALLSDLGYSYYMQGRYADAERYLLESRKLDPNYQTAIANLGLLYGSTGRQQEALAMFRQIGDDEQVQAIMQQIASGEFAPQNQLADDNKFETQQASVVTTQTTVQQAAPVPPQQMNDATRDFVAQLQKAREDLQRAEQELARHQQSQNAQLSQAAPQQTGQQSAWSQQAASQQQFSSDNRQMMSSGQPVPDSALSGAMAGIDRRDNPRTGNNPIVIGQPASTNSPRTATAEQNYWAQAPGNVGNNSGQAPAANQVPVYTGQTGQQPATAMSIPPQQSMPPQQQPAAQPGQPMGTDQSPWSLRQPSQSGAVPTQNSFSQNPPRTAAANPPSAWGRQFAASVNPQGSQNGATSAGAIQQTSGNNPALAQQPVEQAYYTQQPQQQSQNIALTGQTGPVDPSLVPPAMNGNWNTSAQPASNPNTAGASTSPSNSYDEARREAAMLGLNAGPGQVFPYIQQSRRVMPGTDSRLNGAQYPAPVRHMPTGLTPPSTNAGFQPQPQQAYQQPPQQSAPDPYQQTRAQQSEQYNTLVNQTWGQSPQSPPYGVTPPSSMVPYEGSTRSVTPQPSNVTPVPYYQQANAASAPQATPAGYQTQQQPQAQYGAPSANGSAVIPEPYPNNRRATSGNAPLPAIQQRQNDQSSYTGPMIVPGEHP